MSKSEDQLPSSYLQYLPAVLRQGELIGSFLLGFEAILSGWVPPPAGDASAAMPVGLEYALDTLSRYFDPRAGKTPAEFLPWLAQWVALTLRDDWTEESKRALIGSIVPLYALRGTRQGIILALQTTLGSGALVSVVERPDLAAHYFRVQLVMGVGSNAEQIQRTIRMVESVVAQQKPAHTFFSLVIHSPKLRLLDQPVDNDGQPVTGDGVADKTQGIWVVDAATDDGAILLGSLDPVSGTKPAPIND